MRFWCLLLLLPFATAVAGQTSTGIEVPLTFKEFREVDEMVTLSMGGVAEILSSHPPKGYSVLPGTVKPVFFELRLEAGTIVGLSAFSSRQAKGYDRIWVDWNGDKKFTGDEKLMGTVSVKGEDKFSLFGPVERTYKGTKIEGYLIVHDDNHIHLVPKGYYEGEVNLDGQKIKVGIADRNLNGVLGERMMPGTGGWEGDAILVDFDGDGKFGPKTDRLSEIASYLGEVYLLTNLVQFPDGNFYRIKVSENADRLYLERDQAPKGKVKMECEWFVLGLMGQEGALVARGQRGETSLPVGSYQTQWVTMVKEDERGRPWWALMLLYRQSPRLKVTSDKTVDLPFGPPFKLVLDLEQSGRTLDFSLSLKDKSDNSLDAIFTPEMKRPPEPVLVITDEKGKIVKTEKFHYG